MTKIILRIRGGLGNQLFNYAAARRLALVNNAELVIDDVSGFVNDYQYRRNYQLDNFNIDCRKATRSERLEPFAQCRRYLKRRINTLRSFDKKNYIIQNGSDFDLRLLEFKPRSTVYLEGYWQSEKYFKDVSQLIRRELEIKKPNDDNNIRVARLIDAHDSVAVHFRFFDREDEKKSNNAPHEYYLRAFDEMERNYPSAHYFIFSDQPTRVRDCIPISTDKYTCVAHNQGDRYAFADLWLMNNCKHFIIANSTFSWWGAWLGEKPDSLIIAPSFERVDGMMDWGFKGLLPERWFKIS